MNRAPQLIIQFLILFLPISGRKESVDPADVNEPRDSIILNVSYRTHQQQVYDIHLSVQRDSTTPLIVVIHGGAWRAGKKEDMDGIVQLIKQKWSSGAIVNVNYRLSSNVDNIHHPQFMDDIASAIGDVLGKRNMFRI